MRANPKPPSSVYCMNQYNRCRCLPKASRPIHITSCWRLPAAPDTASRSRAKRWRARTEVEVGSIFQIVDPFFYARRTRRWSELMSIAGQDGFGFL